MLEFLFIFDCLQRKDVTFEYPNLFDMEGKVDNVEKSKKQLQEQTEIFQKFVNRNDDSKGSPPWFSI